MAFLLTNSVAVAGHEKTIKLLNEGASSLDAIESGIRLVESDPEVRWVGFGGLPNMLGKVQLDAGIIDGSPERSELFQAMLILFLLQEE